MKSRSRPFWPLCRNIGFRFFFLSLRGFLFRCYPHCLSELRRAITCSITFPPRLVFVSRFRAFEAPRAFAEGRVIFFCPFVAQYQDLSANRRYIARISLITWLLALRATTFSRVFFLAFSVPVISACSLLPFANLYVRTCCLVRCVRV